MANQSMKELMDASFLSGGSEAYLETLYETFLQNPNQVSEPWRSYFANLPQVNGGKPEISQAEIQSTLDSWAKTSKRVINTTTGSVDSELERKQAKVAQMVSAFRQHGHHQAKLDPLVMTERPKVPDLSLEHYHFTESDMETLFNAGDFPNIEHTSLRNIYRILQDTYCRNIGIEYMHISDYQVVRWIQQRFESTHGRTDFSTEKKKRILECLIAAEGLEQFLHVKYVGQKRFSLEGAESLIPMLDEIITRSGSQSVKELVIGMAHRGRLNVLINLLGKAPQDLFKEFEGKAVDKLRSGDVKYHMGFSSNLQTDGGVIHLSLAFNPSHLEIISPVVEGSVRARQERRNDEKRDQVIPILIHGDAAIAGQGIVMETLNMSQARGYCTGGTIHIVVNNQVGFTTSNPLDARSTLYCTDVVKMVQAPVFHVNADDPEAVVFVAQLALDFRQAFKRDVVIDLVCYRRHGHNEADEPMMTQPVMYKKIKEHATTVAMYSDHLKQAGLIDTAYIEKEKADYRQSLEKGHPVVEHTVSNHTDKFSTDWKPFLDVPWTAPYDAKLAKAKLTALSDKIYDLPADLVLQRAVGKEIEHRRAMGRGEVPLNWGAAETLAYAHLLSKGYRVRISGQDCGRGTFSHRHAVLHDQNTADLYLPLQRVAKAPHDFTIIDSILSEAGVLGFEYGFATTDPHTLVIWEAQFGDFVNGAQVVIDQFISSGDQKWTRLCGLTLFLPHGFEGMGPEHSSARLERFLQLAAQENMQICVPTTPAQHYHMLLRQMLRPLRKPLIVLTPKSFLRHPRAISTLDELAKGDFQLVLPEMDEKIVASKVKRIVICTGKVYYDLLARRDEEKIKDVALVRIEQLYPYPDAELKAVFAKYRQAKEVVWCQEEPKNQGAWYRTLHHINENLGKDQELRYAGRAASAAPAVGNPKLHEQEQVALIEQALLTKFAKLEK